MRLTKHSNNGFTLIELMVVIAIVAIIAGYVVPSLINLITQNKLKSASEAVYSNLNFARSEVIKRGVGTDVTASFTTNGTDTWCYGISTSGGCDCTITNPATAGACVLNNAGVDSLKVISNDDFSGVDMTAAAFGGGASTSFSALRGTATSGQVDLRSQYNNDMQLRVTVTALGRVYICAPTSRMSRGNRYPEC